MMVSHVSSDPGEELNRDLSAYLEVAHAVSARVDLPEVLRAVCESAAKLVDADHSGLVLFDENGTNGIVKAEYPSVGASGRRIQIAGVPAEDRLMRLGQPIVAEDLAEPRWAQELGSVYDILTELGVKSILVVPIRWKNQVIGSFSVDSTSKTRVFTQDDQDKCASFASVVASAIHNVELFRDPRERSEMDHAVRAAALRVSSGLSREDAAPESVLRRVVEEAIKLTAAQGGGIYKYETGAGVLVISESSRAEEIGTRLPLLEGIAGQLVRERKPFRAEPDYDRFEGRHRGFPAGHFGAVLDVLLESEGGIFGVLYVHDRVGRVFSAGDCRMLVEFGKHALAALENAERILRLSDSENVLLLGTALTTAAGLSEGLQRYLARMPKLFDASFCRVLLFEDDPASQEGAQLLARSVAAETSGAHFDWHPALGDLVPAANLSGMGRDMSIVTDADKDGPVALKAATRSLSLSQPIRALLQIQLRLPARAIGLLQIGKLKTDRYPNLLRDRSDLVRAIAAQLSAFILRIRLSERNERDRELQRNLARTERDLLGKGPKSIVNDMTRLAVEMLGGRAGWLYQYRAIPGEIELIASFGTLSPNALEEDDPSEWAKSVISGASPVRERQSRHSGREYDLSTLLRVPGESPQLIVVRCAAGASPDADLEALNTLASRAAAAIESARLPADERRAKMLRFFGEVLGALPSLSEQQRLHAVLTAITAEYGLRFNRAALFLPAQDPGVLRGRVGIGPVDETDKTKIWGELSGVPPPSFPAYLQAFSNPPPLDPVHRAISAVRIELSPRRSDLLSRILAEKTPVTVGVGDLDKLPAELRTCLQLTTEVLLVPMPRPDGSTGLLVADNKFSLAPITNLDRELVVSFASVAVLGLPLPYPGSGVEMADLAAIFKEFHPKFHEGSSTVLDRALDIVCARDNVFGASVIFVDMKKRQAVDMICGGRDRKVDLDDVIRRDGLSLEAAEFDKTIRLPDLDAARARINQKTEHPEIRASLCFPLDGPDGNFAVMWIHYLEPQEFSDAFIEPLRIFALGAGLAYQTARRAEQQHALAAAGLRLSGAGTLQQTANELVALAREIFRADFVTFWPLLRDPVERFIREGSARAGFDGFDGALPVPRLEQKTFEVLKEGYVACDEINEEEEQRVIEPDYRMRERFKIISFHAVALVANDEPVGVLYVSFKEKRRFGTIDERFMREFAATAASAVKGAMLGHRLRAAEQAASIVSDFRETRELGATLQSIATRARKAVQCDSVSVFAYDADRREFFFPPGTDGVKDPDTARKTGRVEPGSVLRLLVDRDSLYVSEECAEDELMRYSDFRAREKVRSCIVAPLRAATRRVGLLFLNFCDDRKFEESQLQDYTLFANYAAMAVNIAQLNLRLASDLKFLQGAHAFAREMLGALGATDIVERTVRFITQSMDASMANIVVVENGKLISMKDYGWDPPLGRMELDSGTGSHAGYTVAGRERAVLVEDFSKETRFAVLPRIKEYGIISGAGVPMRFESEVLGALMLHSKAPRKFSDTEVNFLEVVAHQAAAALRGAQRYDELRGRHDRTLNLVKLVDTLDQSGPVVELTTEIVRRAVLLLDRDRGKLRGSLWRLESGALVREAAYPRIPAAGRLDPASDAAGVIGEASRTEDAAYDTAAMAICVGRDDGVRILAIETEPDASLDMLDRQMLCPVADAVGSNLVALDLRLALQRSFDRLQRQTDTLRVVADQLRDPLAHLDFALRHIDEDLSGAHRRVAQIARSSMNDASRLVETLQSYTAPPHVSAGAVADLGEVLGEVVESFQWQIKEREIEVEITFEPGRMEARISRDDLRQILMNLLSNAIRFSDREARIGVQRGSGIEPGFVDLSVEDSGPTVPVEELDAIFAPDLSGIGPPTKLGMFVARQISEVYGGRLSAIPCNSGRRFQLFLPGQVVV
jgi:GAF domain-containing protein